MTIILYYGVSTGKPDVGERFDREVDLTPEQEAAYIKAAMSGREFESFPELKELLQEQYAEIEDQETDTLIEFEDEYTMECLGLAKVDPDEINDLVHDGDAHAIEFFGLHDLDEDELEEWDANDLDELPTIADFQEDFEPQSPFDCGWDLNVWFADEYVDDWFTDDAAFNLTKEMVDDAIRDALKAGDTKFVDDVIETQSEFYSEDEEDLKETACRIAEELGVDYPASKQ